MDCAAKQSGCIARPSCSETCLPWEPTGQLLGGGALPVQTPDTDKQWCCSARVPAHLQVKNFGRRGRTKHAHLVDQDNTKFDDDNAVAKPLQDKYFQKLGGTAQGLAGPLVVCT